jgi:hypothetical protein
LHLVHFDAPALWPRDDPDGGALTRLGSVDNAGEELKGFVSDSQHEPTSPFQGS